MHVRFGGCPRAPARETRTLPTRPLATVWGCGVIFFIRCQLSFNIWTPSCNTFPKIRAWIKQLMVVVLKGYKDGKVFGVSIIVKSISVVGVPRFFMMTKNYIPRPQCQFILVTDHQTPLTMATMANRAKRAAKQLATRTPSSPSSPKMPCSRLRRFVVDALIQTQLAVVVGISPRTQGHPNDVVNYTYFTPYVKRNLRC